MSLDQTVDAELSKLLVARALLNAQKFHEAINEVRKLELGALPPKISHGLLQTSEESTATLNGLIDDALEYYVSVYKLTHGGVIFPEISEKLAVDAINQHWMKSVLFLAMAALVALLVGGTIAGFAQVGGIKDTLNQAQANADKTTGDVATQSRSLSIQLGTLSQQVKKQKHDVESAQDQLNKAESDIQKAKSDIQNKIALATADLSKSLSTELQEKQVEIAKNLQTAGDTANANIATAGKKATDDVNLAREKALKAITVQANKSFDAKELQSDRRKATEAVTDIGKLLVSAQDTKAQLDDLYKNASIQAAAANTQPAPPPPKKKKKNKKTGSD